MQKKNSKTNKDDSNLFKIVSALIKKEDAVTLSEIAKETGLTPSHISYYFKKMKENYLAIECNKEYYCQPLHVDPNIKEDLDALMKVITKIILRELIMPVNATEDDVQRAVIANLEVFIRSFAVEMMN